MPLDHHELRYLVPAAKALQIRDYIQAHIELDERSVGRPNFSYPVHSLYLDSDDLKTYWWTINGDRNRLKLRLRFYDNRPDTPVYFEIKRRLDRIIQNRRAAVRKEAAPWVLAGQLLEPGWLATPDPTHLAALGIDQKIAHGPGWITGVRPGWRAQRADGGSCELCFTNCGRNNTY